MNGKISVDSKPDIGSTFKVELEYKINNNIEKQSPKTILKIRYQKTKPIFRTAFLVRPKIMKHRNTLAAELSNTCL